MSTGRHHNDEPHANPATSTHHGRDAGGSDVGSSDEPGTDTGVVVAFTPRGEAALEELADSLTADLIASLPDDPASLDESPVPAIEALLGQVMSADVEDLAAGLIAADAAHHGGRDRLHGDPDIAPAAVFQPEWETVRAAMVRPGDLTPAGRVDDVDLHGGVRGVDLTIDGVTYGRGFDDQVDRALPETSSAPGDDELDLGLDLAVDQHIDQHTDSQEAAAVDEVARRRLGRTPEQRIRPTAPPRSAAPGR